MKIMLLAALLASAAPARGQGPILTGDVPNSPQLAARLAETWEFVKVLGGAPADLPPPAIYFMQFDPKKQDPAWTAWQKDWASRDPQILVDWVCSQAGRAKHPEPVAKGLCADPAKVRVWLAAHPEVNDDYPFPPTFRAFHYDGTDRIQVNPYTTYTGVIMQAISLEGLGYGYYVTGHEMLHYVLDRKGVPGATHHCLFVTPQADGKSYMAKLADFLIEEKGYAHFMARRLGHDAEVSLNPCGKPAP